MVDIFIQNFGSSSIQSPSEKLMFNGPASQQFLSGLFSHQRALFLPSPGYYHQPQLVETAGQGLSFVAPDYTFIAKQSEDKRISPFTPLLIC